MHVADQTGVKIIDTRTLSKNCSSRVAMDDITNSTPQVNQAIPGQYGCRLLNEFDIMLVRWLDFFYFNLLLTELVTCD